MELIYPYVRDRQLCSRAEFAARHPAPVIVFKKLAAAGQGETQLAQVIDDANAEVAKALRHEAHQYRLLRLAGGAHTIGRAPENALVLNDDSVSRQHAQIVVSAINVTVADAGSDNGTWVLGADGNQKAKTPVTLRDGDRVRFGRVITHFFAPSGFFDFLSTLLDPRAAPGA